VEQRFDETMLGKIRPNGGEHGIEQHIKRNEMMAKSLPRLLDKKSKTNYSGSFGVYQIRQRELSCFFYKTYDRLESTFNLRVGGGILAEAVNFE